MGSIIQPFSGIIEPGNFQVPTGPGDYTIDWTNSLARGLIGCWLPGSMRGIDLSGNAPEMTIESSGGIFDATAEGPGLSTTGTLTGMNVLAQPVHKSWTQATLYWRGYLIGVPAVHGVFIGISYTNTDTSPFVVLCIQYDSAASFGATGNNSGSFFGPAPFTTPPTPPAFVSMAVSWDTVGGTVALYTNGAANGTGSLVGAPSTTANSYICINGWVPVNTRYDNAICNIACMWNRALTAAEIRALDLAPYQFIVPAESEMPVTFIQPPPPLFVLMPQIVM
jgi:hypothetical protein